MDVLVVDDDMSLRSSAAEVLRAAGFSVDEAEDGSVALQIIASKPVAVMVLDVNMPAIDGLQLLDLLTDPPAVVLVTAHPYDGEVVARSSKATTYMQKPVPPQHLVDAVMGALAGHSAMPSREQPQPGVVTGGRDRVADERDRVADARDAVADERDRVAVERDRIADERDRVADARDAVASAREVMADDRDRVANARDVVADGRDELLKARELAADERDEAQTNLERPASNAGGDRRIGPSDCQS